MTLLEHFKDPNFWDILFKDLAICLGAVGFFVVVFWLLDKIKSKPDLTQRLAEQEIWRKKNDRNKKTTK